MKRASEEIKGLDDDSELKNIYIKHINSDKIWTVDFKSARISKFLQESIIDNDSKDDSYGLSETTPLIIRDTVKKQTMPFVIEYMKYFRDAKYESTSPEAPLKNSHISVILGDEYTLFKDMCDEKSDLKTKILELNYYVSASLYFGFKYAHKKICAMIASLLKNKEISELKTLTEI